ncbi:MAG: SDR family oxidoreductase [Mogibacterium sp.]|nr:SDR family oxidoreductase [Mogibacterium sp.]
MNDFTSVKGKVAVVTGATSGLGEAIAKIYAANGMKVVLAGRRKEKGEANVKAIREAGGEALFCQADVSVEEDVKRVMETAVKTYGALNVVVNNAGAGCLLKPIHEYESEEFKRVSDIDYIGVFYGMKYGVKAILDSKSTDCSIINIASAEGIKPTANFAPYSSAKRAVISLSVAAGMDYARHGITVNCIAPGAFDTEIYSTISPEQRALTQSLIPIGRFGRPEEIAYVALFLATDMARYITGAVIPVDGAMSSGNFVEVPWAEADPRV